jgi:pyridoxine 5-phosphate synthase
MVPDDPAQLTSDHGWDTIKHKDKLREIIAEFHRHGIRTSIFVDPDVKMVRNAMETGTDRIELYTESYAREFSFGRESAIKPFIAAAIAAREAGLGLNAGHDLNLENLRYFAENIPGLMEVSIGHALICDALYYGLENSIQLYKKALSLEF